MRKGKGIQVRDTKTGIVYQSKYAAGRAVAAEYGIDPESEFIYYRINGADKERFVAV